MEVETALRDAFGGSSDSEDFEEAPGKESDNLGWGGSIFGESPIWEQTTEINGLWLCRNFLSPTQQSSLLSVIQREGWFTQASASRNQAMRFGDLPEWAIELSNSIREVVFFSDSVFQSLKRGNLDKCKEASPFPSHLLWREPLFDQLILNIYQPGEGICAHVDLMRFEDGIAIISLESSCVMHFARVEETQDGHGEDNNLRQTKIPVLLTPGSLVLMSGEARYLWKHEINRNPGFQIWEGQEIIQGKRTSITLRKLC